MRAKLIFQKTVAAGLLIIGSIHSTLVWADPDANKLLVAKAFEALQTGDVNVINTIFSADGPVHAPNGKVTKQGGPFADLKSACPACASLADRTITVDLMLADGDLVGVRSTWRGNYVGKARGVQISGIPVSIVYFNIYRVKDGQIVENWACRDTLDLATQLGFSLTPPASAGSGNGEATVNDKK